MKLVPRCYLCDQGIKKNEVLLERRDRAKLFTYVHKTCLTTKPKVTFSINEEDVKFTANMVVCSGCASGFAISVYGDEEVAFCPCCGSAVKRAAKKT